MINKIIKIVLCLSLLIVSYYFGTINIYQTIIPRSKKTNNLVKPTPTITPYPTIDYYDVLKVNNNNFVIYNDQKNKISFQYPINYSIQNTWCSLVLSKYVQIAHGFESYIHIAIIDKDNRTSCDWVYHSGEEKEYQLLSKLNVGEKITVSDINPEFFTYARLPDLNINNYQFKHFVSYRVWESTTSTVVHNFLLQTDNFDYWISGLTDEVTSYDNIPYKTLENIIFSFKINND